MILETLMNQWLYKNRKSLQSLTTILELLTNQSYRKKRMLTISAILATLMKVINNHNQLRKRLLLLSKKKVLTTMKMILETLEILMKVMLKRLLQKKKKAMMATTSEISMSLRLRRKQNRIKSTKMTTLEILMINQQQNKLKQQYPRHLRLHKKPFSLGKKMRIKSINWTISIKIKQLTCQIFNRVYLVFKI